MTVAELLTLVKSNKVKLVIGDPEHDLKSVLSIKVTRKDGKRSLTKYLLSSEDIESADENIEEFIKGILEEESINN